MATAKLKFKATYSVTSFKEMNGGNQIDIIKNPNTNKLFFQCGAATGGVSEGYEAAPCVSLVEGTEGEFYLIHKRNEDNVVDTL